MSKLSGHLDEVVVGYSPVPGGSINLRLIIGCLLTISKFILRQRFSIGFLSFYWAGEVSVLVLFWHFQLLVADQFSKMTWLIVIL